MENKNYNSLQKLGGLVLRYGLVIILLWIGLLKFTAYEANGIKPLIENSGLMSWGYNILSVQGYSIFIGIIEILLAVLIAIKPIAPKISVIGSYGAIIMSITTLTFLFTTPPVLQAGHGFPFLSPMPGQFLLKDLLFLGASIWTAGDAMSAYKKKSTIN